MAGRHHGAPVLRLRGERYHRAQLGKDIAEPDLGWGDRRRKGGGDPGTAILAEVREAQVTDIVPDGPAGSTLGAGSAFAGKDTRIHARHATRPG